MIELSDVGKQFGIKTVLHHLKFKAKSGEIIGFIGPNGAGKTTTMRLMMGILSPSSGSITIDSYDPSTHRLQVVKKIGYLPENNPLYLDMKVSEYLDFVAKIKGEEKADQIAHSVGLQDVMKMKIETLSKGYRQRVGLAAALCGNPPILILDEPTSGLDPLEQEKIRTLIHKIGKNKTVIFSTHILSEVEEIADRIIVIFEGKIIFDGQKPKGKGAVEKLFKKSIAEHVV